MSLHNDLRHPNFFPLELLVRIDMCQDYCLIKNIFFFLVLKKNPSRITIGAQSFTGYLRLTPNLRVE